MANPPIQGTAVQGGGEPLYEATQLESLDEIRRALEERQNQSSKQAKGTIETLPFRPMHRAPMALLCVQDDGKADGEWIRLRADRFVIGRSAGHLLIPHDTLMSGQHAELVREESQGKIRWYLRDLNSTNGTFVRVASVVLKHNQEVLVGSKRYRFEEGQTTGGGKVPQAQPVYKTQNWQQTEQKVSQPCLVEILPSGPGQRFPLPHRENWIGHDPAQCSVVLAADPILSPRHARIVLDRRNIWRMQNAGSLNGVWARVTELPIDEAEQFQLGEQRFLIRIL